MTEQETTDIANIVEMKSSAPKIIWLVVGIIALTVSFALYTPHSRDTRPISQIVHEEMLRDDEQAVSDAQDNLRREQRNPVNLQRMGF